MITYRKQLVDSIERDIVHYKVKQDEFMAYFQKDPCRAIRWAKDTIHASTALALYTYYQYFIQNTSNLLRLYNDLMYECHQCAKFRPSSASTLSNMIEDYRRVAMFELADTIKPYLQYSEDLDTEVE